MHFLISAGPTREYLDPVRFISNGSTGKMGYACAAAAADRGHKVTLVAGPVNLEKPGGVKLIKVITAGDMLQAMLKHFEKSDCVIMTAAVNDYRARDQKKYKIQKNDGPFTLELERTEDILAKLGRCKQKQVLIGFAVQDKAARTNARRKLKQKNLDAIVLNTPAAMGADRSIVELLQAGKKWISLPLKRKTAIAVQLIKIAEQISKNN
ncbi:MAG: phosphopantothenoylcysteine decarboxylase [Planctomycetes bacterium]|nr:phosphopantothenoylcysteine decarboxylase [Planctomycetota bacterium]